MPCGLSTSHLSVLCRIRRNNLAPLLLEGMGKVFIGIFLSEGMELRSEVSPCREKKHPSYRVLRYYVESKEVEMVCTLCDDRHMREMTADEKRTFGRQPLLVMDVENGVPPFGVPLAAPLYRRKEKKAA